MLATLPSTADPTRFARILYYLEDGSIFWEVTFRPGEGVPVFSGDVPTGGPYAARLEWWEANAAP